MNSTIPMARAPKIPMNLIIIGFLVTVLLLGAFIIFPVMLAPQAHVTYFDPVSVDMGHGYSGTLSMTQNEDNCQVDLKHNLPHVSQFSKQYPGLCDLQQVQKMLDDIWGYKWKDFYDFAQKFAQDHGLNFPPPGYQLLP